MALAERRPKLPKPLEEGVLRRLVLKTFGQSRWTQDSPVVPDVWIAYIRVAEAQARRRILGRADADRGRGVDLLLTPWTGTTAAEIAKNLQDGLELSAIGSAEIAPSASRVVARLDFETLVSVVIPMTGWWHRLAPNAGSVPRSRERFSEWADLTSGVVAGRYSGFVRFAALVGFVQILATAPSSSALSAVNRLAQRLGPSDDLEDSRSIFEAPQPNAGLSRDDLERLRRGYAALNLESAAEQSPARTSAIWLINLNRPSYRAIFESRKTIKADAAERVFDTVAAGITFAVIDDGIDARHLAFRTRHNSRRKLSPKRKEKYTGQVPADTRITATYDFSLLRPLLAACSQPGETWSTLDPSIKRILDSADPEKSSAVQQLRAGAAHSRTLDWTLIAPLISVDHRNYHPPSGDHGTHVAGIMAADLPNPADLDYPLRGICPGMSLYDLRVFARDGSCAEFSILCALEFVRWLNRDRANPVIHGVNLSLALIHDVDSFACGRTPVCDVCDALVGSGTVVVAAAGNTGFDQSAGKRSLGSGYRSVSITDPGNAAAVITVGSTHRRDPHAYGVSYFSSRGPTGDGRKKPDILAPGEKITSTICDGLTQVKDGTSMAAPHVSAAAALLMSRYPELIGHPLQIKDILMRTAVDLGREPQFQGAGLVDVLRALQSV